MNKIFKGSVLVILILVSVSGQSQDVQYYYNAAKEAFEQKDYDAYYRNIKEANKLHPYHQVILYRLGIASALVDKPEEAIMALNKAIHIDASFDLEIEALKSLEAEEAFINLKQTQKNLQVPIINSDTAFVVNDGGSHIESVAYDSKTKSLFLGSIHKRKIIKRDKSGKVTDFTRPGEYGIGAVFGLRIDSKKGFLWACSSRMQEMENYDSTLQSSVYKFEISTGRLLNKYATPVASVFGDLTIDSNGKVFVSDGQSNTIFVVNEKENKLDSFFTNEAFWNIQGISFSEDDKYLFISDYIKGPFRLEVATKKLTKLEIGIDQSLKGVDGMLYYKNSLIAIQNGVTPLRVTKYLLNKEKTAIVAFEIIDRAHPSFNEPTIGCLVNDQFYYVANSLWGAYDENFKIKPELVKDLVILHTDLSKAFSKP